MTAPFTPSTGSASISTTEFSLPSNSTTRVAQTTACRLVASIDLSNMVAGDQYRIRVYDKVNGSAQLVLFEAWPTGAQTGAYVLPLRSVNEGWDVTLLLITGSARTVGWTLKLDLADVNVASLTAGAITAAAIASAAITAAKFATDAIDSTALAASAVTEIQAGLATGSALATVQADTDDIQARLPAALVGGRISADVGSWLGTAAAAPTVAGVPKVEVSSMGTGTITAAAIASSALTAAKFATDAIDSNALAATAVTEIQAGLATSSALTSVNTNVSAVGSAVLAVNADTDDIQGRLPAALDGSGNIKASITGAALTAITDAIFAVVLEPGAVSTARTVLQRLRLGLAILLTKGSGLAISTAATEHFRDGGDTKDRAVFTLATDGTRVPTTLDGD